MLQASEGQLPHEVIVDADGVILITLPAIIPVTPSYGEKALCFE